MKAIRDYLVAGCNNLAIASDLLAIERPMVVWKHGLDCFAARAEIPDFVDMCAGIKLLSMAGLIEPPRMDRDVFVDQEIG